MSSPDDSFWGPPAHLPSNSPPPSPTPAPFEDMLASPTTIALFDELPFNKIDPASFYPPAFTCFPNLPLELRLSIWKMTFLPRVVVMTFSISHGFQNLAPMPVALSINRESRELALAAYPNSFGSRMYPGKSAFNFSLDTIYLQFGSQSFIFHLFGVMTIQEMKDLRYLAIDYQVLSFINTKKFLKLALKELPRLENLFIVYGLPGMGRSRHCSTISCMVFRDNLPYELIDSDCIEDTVKRLREDDCADLDSEETSRCKNVYGWKECHCEDQQSNSDSSDEWDDEEEDDSDGYGDYEDYDSDGFGDDYGMFGIGSFGWTDHEIYGDDMSNVTLD